MNSITIDNNKENGQKKKSLLPFYLGLLPVLLLCLLNDCSCATPVLPGF
jgi:hypothetical protein